MTTYVEKTPAVSWDVKLKPSTFNFDLIFSYINSISFSQAMLSLILHDLNIISASWFIKSPFDLPEADLFLVNHVLVVEPIDEIIYQSITLTIFLTTFNNNYC